MIIFDGDERFADVEFIGVQYNILRRELALRVSSDPADNCETIVLRHVAAFDVVHFARQNVVHYVDIARLASVDQLGFCELAQSEGALLAMVSEPDPDSSRLGVIFVSAAGATVFAICQSVEKHAANGQAIYVVSV